MGEPKYAYLGRRYEMERAALDESAMQRLRAIART